MTWRRIITNAKKTGRFTESAKTKANSWCFCAVGEKLNLKEEPHPRSVINGHYDGSALFNLGRAFARAVKNDDVESAEDFYNKIRAV